MSRELEFHPNRLPFDPTVEDEDVAPPINWANLAIRNRILLGIGALVGSVLGLLGYLRSGPEYVATAQIMVNRRAGIQLGQERTVGDFGDRSEHIKILTTAVIADPAIEIGNLRSLPTFRNDTELVDTVKDGLKVRRSAGQDRSFGNILELTFTSSSASDARKVLQSVIEAYKQYLERQRNLHGNETFRSAQKAWQDHHDRLVQKIEAYQKFRENAPLQWRAPIGVGTTDATGGTTNVHQERVIALEEQRRLMLIKRAEVQSKLRSIEMSLDRGESRESLEPLIRRMMQAEVSGGGGDQRSQEMSVFEQKLLPLQLQEQQLTRDLGKDHPEVRSVRKSIDLTLEFYRQYGIRLPNDRTPLERNPGTKDRTDIVGLYVATLKENLVEFGLREQELAGIVAEETEKAKEFARFQTIDQQLNTELISMRELENQLIGKMNAARIDKESSGYMLETVGDIKDAKSLKKMIKFLGMGIGLGLAVVAAWCVFRELRDQTLKSVADVRRLARMPMLGSVSEFHGSNSITPDGRPVFPSLRVLTAPQSLESENIRSVRTALLIATENSQARVLVVSSPEPSDGKTTFISNLAISMAQSGKRILLIDGDLRRPKIHSLFGIRSDIGFTEILQGEIDCASAVQPTVIPGLTLLSAGHLPPNPAELLASERVHRVLQQLRNDYDLVLIDAPPLMAVSDPCIISRHTDGMILTVRLSKTKRAVLRRAIDVIGSNNVRVLGVVANCVVHQKHTGNHTYYYEYQPAPLQMGANPQPQAVGSAKF